MDFAPFIMGFPMAMEGDFSFLVPPGVTEIGVLAVGGAGGDNPVYNIVDDFVIRTIAGGEGDCVVASSISVTPGEVLTLVFGSDGGVPQYETTSQREGDNMLICTGIVAGGRGYAPGGDGGNAGGMGGCGSSGGGGTAVLRGSTPLVVAGGGGGAGGFGDSAQSGGVGGSAAGSGGDAPGSSGGGGGQGAGWGSGQGQPGGSPGGINLGGGGGGGGGGWNGGLGGGRGGSDGGGGGGGAGSGPPGVARQVSLAAPQRVWKLVIWSPPDPQPTDHLFTLPF